MQQPLCSNRDDGECPNFALNGTPNCLQHTEETGLWDPVDIGYRPGGLASVPTPLQMFATALRGFEQSLRSATEAVRQFDTVIKPTGESQP
ncbi:hypothetical protein CU254_14780 [Amycolatopsis sp. AA4]|uniref:hypothetical protein n=1 Tax=Actinomycetes TaxID=1760 RepID=UPI0001B55016|nr:MULTISPECIES: hypothetical protein [Actinomycetes]ATY11583.1 hypothetical protein CU254_14780 [Amycolatopsis sp. AA4]EFL07226.1 hypothetical protein SSMG_02897 [Streptomyces sp. AA4]